jgi:hypothetical protein
MVPIRARERLDTTVVNTRTTNREGYPMVPIRAREKHWTGKYSMKTNSEFGRASQTNPLHGNVSIGDDHQ